MFFTQPNPQIKVLNLTDKVKLYQPSEKDGYRFNFEIPNQYLPTYKKAIATFGNRYQFVAKTFHQLYPNPPYVVSDFLDYMKLHMGFEITVVACTNPFNVAFSGTWQWDNSERKSFTVFVNAEHPEEKQKVTIIHECIHVLQDFDQEFKEELAKYPVPIQMRIADRIAEKAAVEVLMPKSMVTEDIAKGFNLEAVIQKYAVSRQMAGYAFN